MPGAKTRILAPAAPGCPPGRPGAREPSPVAAGRCDRGRWCVWERVTVADDVQVAVAVDVGEGEAVVDGAGAGVQDAPGRVHCIRGSSAAGPAQELQVVLPFMRMSTTPSLSKSVVTAVPQAE